MDIDDESFEEDELILSEALRQYLDSRQGLNRNYIVYTYLDGQYGPTVNGPLQWCAFDNEKDFLLELLETPGFDVNDRCGYGYTALHNAVYRNHLEIVKILVEEFDADLESSSITSAVPVPDATPAMCCLHPQHIRAKGSDNFPLIDYLDEHLALQLHREASLVQFLDCGLKIPLIDCRGWIYKKKETEKVSTHQFIDVEVNNIINVDIINGVIVMNNS